MDDRDTQAATGSSAAGLSLVIPAYNEAAGMGQALAEAGAALAELAADYEILVVDDGSSDGTAEAVLAVAATDPHVRLLRHPRNQGYGAALRTGFAAARFDRVAFTDADCQFHLADLAPLLAATKQHPVAAGRRLQRQDPWQRRFLSWGYNRLVRTLLGTQVQDCDCALKVFRREALVRLLPESSGFFVNTEMLTRARQLGLGVAEVGVRHRPRLRGSSKVSLGDVPRTLRTLLPFWWSRVLFPGSDVATSVPPVSRGEVDSRGACRPGSPRTLLEVLSLVMLAALLFFSRLGAPLQEPDEARYAEIPRQMLVEGRWLVPVLHGLPYLDKPPLLYWLVMSSYRVFGVHDWAARLVPAACAFLVIPLAYFWARRTVGDRAAWLGTLVLCLSARFVYLGRLLTMDSLLCLCVTAALAAAHQALAGPRLSRGWWLASAFFCGLGLLTKGPVALALVAGPVLAYIFLDPRAARPGWRGGALYLVAALAVAAPWYLAVTAHEPAFLGQFLWRHNVVRYVAPFDHAKPAWYHVTGLLLGMLPWTLLLPGFLRFLARQASRTAARRPPALGFFLLAAGWSLLFFSLAGCKRAVYVLPALPPLALALGCYLAAVLPQVGTVPAWNWAALAPRRRSLSRLALASTVCVLLLGAGMAVAAVPGGVLRPTSAGLLATGALIALALALWRVWVHGARPSWAWCAASTFAVLFAGMHLVLPGYARKFSLRGPLRPQAELCADPQLPVVCYPRRWDSVGFYLRRNDVRVYTPEQTGELLAALRDGPSTLLVVKSDGALAEVLSGLPNAVEFVPRGRRGTVTVGLVRQRQVAPDALFAHHQGTDRGP